jgi:hypothetical protein
VAGRPGVRWRAHNTRRVLTTCWESNLDRRTRSRFPGGFRSVESPGDPRTAGRRDPRCLGRTRRRRRARTSRCPRPCASSARASRGTATGRPISPCSSPKAGMPPRDLAAKLAAALEAVTASPPSTSPARASSISPGRGERRRTRADHRGGRARHTGAAPARRGASSTSNTSPPIPPGRSTSGIPGGRPSATRWPGCSKRRGRGHRRSTTSTTTVPRSTGSPVALLAKLPLVSRHPRTATGEYVEALAEAVRRSARTSLELPREEAVARAWRSPIEIQLAQISGHPASPSVSTSTSGSHESDLHASGAVERAIARLRELGPCIDKDGAIWLRTTDFGDDKDRVSDPRQARPISPPTPPTTCPRRTAASMRRSIMLGADHHGYVNRLKAIAAAPATTPSCNIEVKIGQLVNIAGERMGKRRATPSARRPHRVTWARRRCAIPCPLAPATQPARRWTARRCAPDQ